MTLERIQTMLKTFANAVWQRVRHPTVRGVVLTLAALPVLLLAYVLALIPFTPSIADLRKVKTVKPSIVMSADGQELASFKRSNRDWVQLANISPNVITALVATEDHRFYDHYGLDFKRTASAILSTATGDTQGGSTITQQLARNLYPEAIGRAPTLTRKLKELITSFKIEAVYTKDEILETYLNTVPFLYNAYGIEMAARTYFDKSADELDVLQSATLVGMLKGTSYYNPVSSPERALQRRNTVLSQLVKHNKLPAAQLAALKTAPLKIDFERQTEELGAAPHLSQQLRRWLIEWADRNDYNIYADGLVLHTTIDSRLQDMANEAVTLQGDKMQKIIDGEWRLNAGWAAPKAAKGKLSAQREQVMGFVRDSREYKSAMAAGTGAEQAMSQLLADDGFMQKLRDDKLRVQAGFMALDPGTGQIRAWVGSRDFADDQFDHVSQARRQPGSTFKPFVYGAAFEDGKKPSDGYMDKAIEISLGNGAFWRPGDAGGPSGAWMSLRQGLMYSKNTITAQVMQAVGPAHVARLARDMGVRSSTLDEVPALALGTSPVTLKEMVSSYATLANDGNYVETMLVTKVADRNGVVLESFEPKRPETVMATPVAQSLLDVLRGVVDQGTGTGIRGRFGIRADVAGKTGTSQDNTDGWFILMHPQLVAGAWVGFNDSRITMGNSWGPGAQSALPVVGEFYRQAIKAKIVDAAVRFVAPKGVGAAANPSLARGSSGEAAGTEQAVPSGVQMIEVPEGAWQPAPVIRYITVPPEAMRQDSEPQAVIIPRDLQPPEPRRSRPEIWTPMNPR